MRQLSEKAWFVAILVIAVCVTVTITYRPALSAKALSFDDEQYLTGNMLVRNPSWASAKIFFTEVLEPSTVAGYYQPLTMISLMFDYAAGGRENNLRPFHITSLALHTANTALVIMLLYLLFNNIWAAAAAGLLFGVHPITIESISWVSERKTLLAAFFALWSLILYVLYSRRGGWKSYAGCFLMYLLSLLSKPTSVPLPVVMLLMDYWPLKRLSIKSVLEKVPLFILSVVSAIITYISQSRTFGTVLYTKYGPEAPLLMICHNIIFYLYKIFLPTNLSWHYIAHKPFNLTQPMVLAGVIGTCVLIPILILSLRWTRAAFTGWLIFFVAIFPAIGVVGFTVVIAADRFAYFPSIGLLMVMTSFLIWFCSNNKKRMVAIIVVLIVASAEAVATRQYLVYWQDSLTLINRMLTFVPDSALLYNHRAVNYVNKGRIDLAISDFNKAIEINPKYTDVYINRATVYSQVEGRYDLAVSDYNKALEINPMDAHTYNNLGVAYGKLGRWQDEVKVCNEAIKIDPAYADAHNNLGVALGNLGRYPEAIRAFDRAIRLNPNFAEAHLGIGIAHLMSGDKNSAVKEYEILKTLDPQKANLLLNLLNQQK